LEQHYLDKYVTLGFVIIKTKYNYATTGNPGWDETKFQVQGT